MTPRHDDRPGGDLRAGAVDHPLRHRGRGGRDRQRHPLRAGRRRLVRRPGAGQGASPGACAPARSRSTAARSTRWPRSAATSSPGSAASTAASGSRSSWRPRPSSCRPAAHVAVAIPLRGRHRAGGLQPAEVQQRNLAVGHATPWAWGLTAVGVDAVVAAWAPLAATLAPRPETARTSVIRKRRAGFTW